MGIWTWWLGRSPEIESSDVSKGATCPCCRSRVTERLSPAAAYPIWDSECGSIGSGSPMYQDLDEVADGLLAVLGIPGSVSEPCIPYGGSGMVSMQHYDIPKSLAQLQEILRAHGFGLATNTWDESGHTVFALWVRRVTKR